MADLADEKTERFPLIERTPLAQPDWSYAEGAEMQDYTREEWTTMDRQRAVYYGERQAKQALDMLELQRDDPSFGYQINNYGHCLQSATAIMQAGYDEETIVVALLHDVGFIACPTTHGEFAAAMLGPYISEKNHWMLQRHALFQNIHVIDHPDESFDRHARDKWKGHPHFAWTAEYVAKFDQNTIRSGVETAPIEFFKPMVQRIFARKPRVIEID